MYFTNLFVYGTLVKPEVREDLLGRPHEYLQKDSVRGYSLDSVAIDGVVYPALVEDTMNSVVDGFVTVINESEFRVLDDYETDAYGRRFIELSSGRRAWAYVKKDVESVSASELDLIASFKGDPNDLMALIKRRWRFNATFQCSNAQDEMGNLTYTMYVDAWKGHNDIVEAMKRNVPFWENHWYSTNRFGEYVFKMQPRLS